MDTSSRALEIEFFERDTEMLAVAQLDLLAQLERQLRAVHHTMRQIDKLRSVTHRVETELSPVPSTGPTSVDEAIEALDSQLHVEHSCCCRMRDTIIRMRTRLADLRRRTSTVDPPGADPSQPAARS